MINNIYGGLLSILWRTAQIVFLGGGRAEEMVLGSGPLVLGKAKEQGRKRRSWVLGPWFWEARAEEREKKVLGSGPWVLGRAKAGKAGNEFSRS
ncbi:hypothetical protein BOO25_19140 [Vibrio navarrensis]|uniref:hypothetical protein n=1 Tax=Vibrio navarrensis TaxID=29495 RepID=UPI00192F77EB|nr:hypothetical protein [Vibrio navarrensis]MBE3671047.1 hypothetical protein [Vibrio navarrensis]